MLGYGLAFIVGSSWSVKLKPIRTCLNTAKKRVKVLMRWVWIVIGARTS